MIGGRIKRSDGSTIQLSLTTLGWVMAGKNIKVVTIDDHVIVQEAISSLIDGRDDMELVGSETTGSRGLCLVSEMKPDVAVIDISLPDMNGLILAQRIISENPTVNVVVLSMHDERSYVQRALELGVKAYISKRSQGEHLLQAISSAAEGGVYIDPAVAARLRGGNGKSVGVLGADGCGPNLTDREADVVRLIALGYTAKEIAAQLGVTAKSVETYKARACEKLDMKTRKQLVRYAATQGWLAQL